MASMRLPHATGYVPDVVTSNQPPAMTPAKKKPSFSLAKAHPPPPPTTRKVKRDGRISLQDLTNARRPSQERPPVMPPAPILAYNNRGRSRSVAAIDVGGLSQEEIEAYSTPSEGVVEAWASQEQAMPPTPDHQHKKKRKTGPLYSMTRVGEALEDEANRQRGNMQVGRFACNGANINVFLPGVHRECAKGGADVTPSPNVQLIQNSRWAEEFKELGRIGKGNGGVVYRGRNYLTGWEYAIKVSREKINQEQHEATRRERLKEVFAHAAVSGSPSIVTFYDAWCDHEGSIHIQMEYCPNGTLKDKMAQIAGPEVPANHAEEGCLRVLEEVARGLQHMHHMDIAHLDVKPANVLLADLAPGEQSVLPFKCKIADFGLVASALYGKSDGGDRTYLCKKLMEQSESMLPGDLKACDIFALALTIYELATGRDLPDGGELYHRLREVNDTNEVLPGLERYSRGFARLLAEMLHEDERSRLSADQILSHEVLLRSGRHDDVALARNNFLAKFSQLMGHRHRLEKAMRDEGQENGERNGEKTRMGTDMGLTPCNTSTGRGRHLGGICDDFDDFDDDDDDDGVMNPYQSRPSFPSLDVLDDESPLEVDRRMEDPIL